MAPDAQTTTPCPHCGKQYTSSTRICPDDGTVIEHASPLVGQVGSVLDGKYRLEGFLSHGGMGAVYRATHVMLGKTVAVKLINPELVTSPEIVRRFQREARAATALNHFNIVAVYDLGQTADGTLYIAMEFIDGPSLKEAIQQSHGLSADRAITLLRQVASALSTAHRAGIIHRDLKPHNIMLARGEDGREVVKLVDFGIAKTFDEGTKLTSTGFPIGTPHYMPPEQASGATVDARSDLYSVGVILYEMLTGNVPFDGDSTPVILIKHIKEPPIAPSIKTSGGVPAALDAIALRLLQKDPANRFQSADELAVALDQAASVISGGTRPMSQPIAPTTALTAPTVPRPSAVEPTIVAPTVAAPKRASTDDGATVPMPPPGGGPGATVPMPQRATTPAPTPPRAQTPAPPPAQAPPLGPPAAVPQPAQAAAPVVAVPAAAAPVSVQRSPEPLPSPALLAAGRPASKSSSAVVLSVLVLGIVAALGAAYYLNGLANRPAAPAGATTTSPAPAAAAPASPPAAQPDSSANQPTQASASSPAGSAATPESPPAAPPAPSPPVANDANRPPATPPAGIGAKSPLSGPPSSVDSRQTTAASRQPPANAPSTAGGPVGGASARARSTAGGQASTTAPSTTAAQGTPVARGSTLAAPAARREEPVQAAPGFPEKPAVYFRCTGPSEVCNPLRTAVDDALGNAGLTSVRRANLADVDVSAQVEVVQQNVDRQFGQTFATRSYSVVLSGETTKTGEVVTMPSVANFSFDQRVGSERATERSRLISSDLVEKVKEFAAKKRSR